MARPAPASHPVVDLERRFWQSLVDQDAGTALSLQDEPALMAGSHGAMRFDHATYRRMAEQGPWIVRGFDFEDVEVLAPTDDTAVVTYRVTQQVARRESPGDLTTQRMVDTSVWVRRDGRWACVMHTEAEAAPASGAQAS